MEISLVTFNTLQHFIIQTHKTFIKIYQDFHENILELFWIIRRISGGKHKNNDPVNKGTKMICLSAGIVGLYSDYV